MLLFFVVVGIFLTPILLLAVPIELEYCYDSHATQRSRTRIVWFFGLVRFSPSVPAAKQWWQKKGAKPFTKKKKERGKPGKADKKGIKVALAVLGTEGFVPRLARLIYDVLTVAKIKTLTARFNIGLDDPADTGRIYGMLAPLFSLLYAIPKLDFVAVPVFHRAVMESNVQTSIRVVPISYLKAFLSFMFSPAMFRAIGRAIKAYRL